MRIFPVCLFLCATVLAAPAFAGDWEDCIANDQDRSIKGCTAYIKQNPKDAKALNNRGNACYQKLQYDLAIADYTSALNSDPKYYVAFQNRAKIHSAKGRHEDAIVDLSQAIFLNPNYPSAFMDRGDAYRALSNYDQAIFDYNKAINISPSFPNPYFKRGLSYADKLDFKIAIHDYNFVIQKEPTNARAYTERAVAFLNLGNSQSALSDLNRAIELDRSLSYAYAIRGGLLEKIGRLSEAVIDYRQALQAPQEDTNSKWAHDTARGRLAALEKPVVATPLSKFQLAPATSMKALRRVALVIGVDSYKSAGVRRLNNSRRNAAAIADVLREQGFEVTVKTDLDFADFDDALKDFRQTAAGADMAVIYYAGHGFSAGADDVIAPSDIGDLCGAPPYKRSISVAALGDALAPAKHRLVVLDACRNAPSINCPSRGDDEGFRGLPRGERDWGRGH